MALLNDTYIIVFFFLCHVLFQNNILLVISYRFLLPFSWQILREKYFIKPMESIKEMY